MALTDFMKDPQSEIESLREQLAECKRERDHWKANHDNRVEAARVLIERPDIPFERVQAYRAYVAIQDQLATTRQQLEVAVKVLERILPMAGGCYSEWCAKALSAIRTLKREVV